MDQICAVRRQHSALFPPKVFQNDRAGSGRLCDPHSRLYPTCSSKSASFSKFSSSILYFISTFRQSLPNITNLLLTLPRLGNPYLSQSSYSILSEIFALPIQDESIDMNDQISAVLKAVLASPPSKADATLSPACVQVLGTAMTSYHSTDSNAA